jgi:pyruvate,water dikinase
VTEVLEFDDPAATELRLAGGKGTGLATMTAMGIPVPPGFIVPTRVYRDTIRETGIELRLRALLENACAADSGSMAETSRAALGLFSDLNLPKVVAGHVRNAFARLATRSASDSLAVAVRSSATAEDAANASFAGEYDTYLDVGSAEDVIHGIVRCWASMFSVQALSYASKAEIEPRDVTMAVVVQKMVRARSAGVMFTLSPLTGDRSRIVIESTWGLGVGIVGGEITPDSFVVSKIRNDIVHRNIMEKTVEFQFGQRSTPVPKDRQNLPSISDAEVQALARFGMQLERHHGHPVDVEWAIDSAGAGEIYLLQCRPETVWCNRNREPSMTRNAVHLSALMRSMASKVSRE